MAFMARGIPVVKGTPIVADQHPDQCLARVYVWQLPVRISHWVIVVAIATLSFTGYYIHNPFMISRQPATYMMGTVRYIHILAGFTFFAAFVLRCYYFVAGNYWASWRFFIPTDRQRVQSARDMFKYYSFLRREPVRQVGHNALAGLTYSFMFLLMACESLTGLVLYSNVRGPGFAKWLVGWIPRVIDIQYLRLAHFMIMFAFLAFVIHHVYSAVLVSIEERNGLIESMFSGFKFVLDYEIYEQEMRRKEILQSSLPSRIAQWWNRRYRKAA